MKLILTLVLFFIASSFYAQETDEEEYAEIFVIDSYITPKPPYKFKLTFFTDSEVKSKLILDNKHEFEINTEFKDEHKAEIDLTEYSFDSLFIPYYVILIDKQGKETKTEINEVEYPYEEEVQVSKFESIVRMCAGSLVFLIPSPGVVWSGGEEYFSLSKELPLFSFYAGGYNYPFGYLGLEYTYIFKAPQRNYLRFGYKHIFEVPIFEFVSPGVDVFTNFLGLNGVSPEVTLGLFKINNAMTIYSRYRYSFQPNNTSMNFHDVSIGIFSHFFSLNF